MAGQGANMMEVAKSINRFTAGLFKIVFSLWVLALMIGLSHFLLTH